jgi:hypothetical protein
MSFAGTLSEAFGCDLRTLEVPQRLQHFYTQMVAIRECDSHLLKLFSEGLVRGTVHTCLGQEACAVGVVNAFEKTEDIVFLPWLRSLCDAKGALGKLCIAPSRVYLQ